jgi:hypothetical protein
LLRAGLAGNRVLLDLSCDLLIPPLSRLAVASVFGLLVTQVLAFALHSFMFSTLSFAFCVWAVVLYVLRGWMVSGTGMRGLLDLGLAPVYVLWKAGLRLRGSKAPSTWVRTKREDSAGPP